MVDDWRKPYRTMDQSGSPQMAGPVGRRWIEDVANEFIAAGTPEGLLMTDEQIGHGGQAIVLYRNTQVVAVATIFRDPVNFSILVRWRA